MIAPPSAASGSDSCSPNNHHVGSASLHHGLSGPGMFAQQILLQLVFKMLLLVSRNVEFFVRWFE